MVRISDARMSGTSFGTVVLHVAPESAVGGPLAAVRTGDVIELDTAGRRIELLVPQEEIAAQTCAISAAGLRNTSAATESCSWSTSRKPISAAISIFCALTRQHHNRMIKIRQNRLPNRDAGRPSCDTAFT